MHKTFLVIVILSLVAVSVVPSASARLIPCQDPETNFKPACAYYDSNGDYRGDCYGFFLHHPVTNDEYWVQCFWN